ADETQLLPPQQPDPQRSYGGAMPPPHGAPADETQVLPPQAGPGLVAGPGTGPAPGGMPPSPHAQGNPESTQQLRRVPGRRRAGAREDAQPRQPQEKPFGLRPGAPEERQPPAEFDSLFRPAPDAGAGPAQGGYGYPHGSQGARSAHAPHPGGRPGDPGPAHGHGGSGGYEGGDGHDGYGYEPEEPRDAGGRRRSPVLIVAVAALAIVAAGLAGGAALNSGGDEPQPGETKTSQPSSEPGADGGTTGGDTAEEQAQALDELLADSNNSRDSVISSVENIKRCKKLGQSAKDLRAAAGQRDGLVERLGKLSLDKLPDHEKLSGRLEDAWKASAEADEHYADWADQVAGEDGCDDGEAKLTESLRKGHRASGDATSAKEDAAALWNPVAREYGLTERKPTQL
ncbi:hypothetical protein, partial [Streptomyces sp. JJ38]|uniref:hypothetical protein n=1 Tax=Streptomyces sp. JJ38 TaxID=2738128 RepID=UPI001C56B33E